jgi:DNA-binding XRE family transcriptional regulator
MTQEQLANAFGVTRAAIGHWENDLYQPDLNTAIKIAKYFDVSLDYVIGLSNEPINLLSQSEQALIQTIRERNLKIDDFLEFANYKTFTGGK